MIKRIIIILLSIVFILLLCFVFLTTSQAGLDTSLYLAKKILPGTLSVTQARGRLVGPLTISDLSYQNQQTRINLSTLDFDWRPAALFTGRLSVKKLYINGLTAQLPQSQEEKTKKEKTDTSLSLPIQLTMQNISLHHISIQQGDAAPINIQRSDLNAISSGQTITIHQFKLDSAPYFFSLKGKISLEAPYTTDITGKLLNNTRYFSNVSTSVHLRGDTKKVTLSAHTAAPYKGELNAEIDHPLQHGKVNVHGSWDNIIWPLANEQFISIGQGKLSVTGTLKNYLTTLSTNLNGSALPSSELKLDGSGNWESFKIHTLHIKTLTGTLSGNGQITWAPHVAWQLHLEGARLNPAIHWNNWPGSINFKLASNGSIINEQAAYEVDLDALSGSFNHLPLSGSAKVIAKNNKIKIQPSLIVLGKNRLQAQGTLGKTLNLSWDAAIQQLNVFDKQATGQILSKGTVTGSAKQPKLQGNINITSLKLLGLTVKSFAAQANADFYQAQPSLISIQGKNIAYQNFHADSLNLSLAGNNKQQTGKFSMLSPHGNLTFDLNTQMIKNKLHGSVTRLDFISKLFGTWHLKAPTKFTVDKQHFTLSPFCWSSKHGSVCGDGFFHSAQKWAAKLNIHQLNLGMFQNLLPENIRFNGNLNTKIDLKTNKKSEIRGHAIVNLTQANLGLKAANKIKTIRFINSYLKANISKKGLVSEININDAQHLFPLKATLNLPNYTGKGLPAISSRLQGTFYLKWPSLAFLNGFIPDTTNLNGQVNANVKIQGDIESPKVQGSFSLNNVTAKLEKFGINITRSNFTASAKGTNKVDLKGQFNINNKPLLLNGFTTLSPTFSPSELTIKGKDINIFNTKEYSVFISPDMKVNYTQPALRISGTLTIPKASLTPKDFTSTVSLPDNVIVEGLDNGTASSKIKTYVNLEIILGDAINLQYAGLNADLTGKLKVNLAPDELATGVGTLKVSKGFYSAYGQYLTIKNGVLMFTGGALANPALNILAVKKIKVQQLGQALSGGAKDITAGVQVSGMMNDPKVSLYSSPTLSQSDILSYLLFGQKSGGLSDSKYQVLGQAAASLGLGGSSVTGDLKKELGLSEFGVESNQVINPETNQTQQNSSFVVGKKLTRRLSVSYSVGILIPVNILTIRYLLSQSWTVQTDASTYGTGADILYTIERD
jgi:translocation and assembly module TamB